MSGRMSTAEYRQLMGIDIPGGKEVRGNASRRDSKPRTKKPRNNEEDRLTMQVADYCELLMKTGKIQCFSHIPQETFTDKWTVKNKNTAMGVRSGVPDMLIVYPDKVLFLELKREKGGRVSDAQKFWLNALNNVADANGGVVFSIVAAGWNEAKAAIDTLLE